MAVRVKVRVKSAASSKTLDLVVLANGGAESPKPCLVLDEATAAKLKLWPAEKASLHQVEEATTIGEAFIIENAVELQLLDEEDQPLETITADLVICKGLLEPLITDITIDQLGIQVISFSKGLWKHKKDPPTKIRTSPKQS